MDASGKARSNRVERVGEIWPGWRHTGASPIDSPRRIPSTHRMLRFEYLVRIHAGKKIIALIKFADMVETEPTIFAGPIVAAPAAIYGRCAKFAAFRAAFNCAVLAVGFDAAMRAVRSSFGGSFSQIPFGLSLSKPGCPLC